MLLLLHYCIILSLLNSKNILLKHLYVHKFINLCFIHRFEVYISTDLKDLYIKCQIS